MRTRKELFAVGVHNVHVHVVFDRIICWFRQ
jgi:hypothetical protein